MAQAPVPARAAPQQGPASGFHSQRLHIIDLGPEIAPMQGFGLWMTKVTVDPGSFFGMHSHVDHPEILYILEGTLSEERPGSGWREHGPGSVVVLTKEITHALANRSDAPVSYMAASVRR